MESANKEPQGVPASTAGKAVPPPLPVASAVAVPVPHPIPAAKPKGPSDTTQPAANPPQATPPTENRLFSRLKRLIGGMSGGAEPRKPTIHLAAFGKHPGWDDHLLDLGADTDELIDIQRDFYVRGIGENVGEGTWEKLAGDERLPAFEHAFIWRRGEDLFAGRLWPSRDGKMRQRYPLIACAQITGLPMAWVVKVLPEWLERAKEQCVATQSADAVRAVISNLTTGLRQEALAPGAGAETDAGPAANPFRFLMDRPELGPQLQGLLSLLHDVDGDMAPYKADADRSLSRSITLVARHLRVPSCGLAPFHSMQLWLNFLSSLLSKSARVLAIAPLEQPWVDLIVGDPAPQDFFCLMVTRKKIPLTSEIPYKLDDQFIKRASRLIEQRAGMGQDVSKSAPDNRQSRH